MTEKYFVDNLIVSAHDLRATSFPSGTALSSWRAETNRKICF